MFCNRCIGRDKLLSCTSDHMALGSCAILHYDHVPPQYRYFDDPTASGSESNWMDYCPFIQPYSNTKCADGNPHVLPGCRLGPTSRCVRGENLYFIWRRLGDVCADVRCDNGTVSLRFIHEVTWMVCPEGSQITLTGVLRGKIVCPKYSQICRETGSDKSKVDLSQWCRTRVVDSLRKTCSWQSKHTQKKHENLSFFFLITRVHHITVFVLVKRGVKQEYFFFYIHVGENHIIMLYEQARKRSAWSFCVLWHS